MRHTPSSTDLVVIDGLMLMFVRRVYGALDLGLTLLLDSPRDKYPHFVAEHVARPMRALSEVLRLAVREAVAEPASSPFEAIAVDTERFIAAMLELADFGVAPSSDMESAAARLGEALRRLDDSVRDVGERLCFEPAAAGEMAARQARYRAIVEHLPADLAAERSGRG